MLANSAVKGTLVSFLVGITELNVDTTEIVGVKKGKSSPSYPDVIPTQKIVKVEKKTVESRGPADLPRCGEQQAAVTPSAPAEKAAPSAPQEKAPSAAAPPVEKAAPAPEKGPDVAESEGEGDSVDIEGIVGDVFTRKDGKCKVDTPWVKLDFDCKDKGKE